MQNGDRIQVGSNIFEFRIEKILKPQKKPFLGILAKAALGIVILAGFSFGVYKIFLTPRPGKLQKVIMQTLWEQPTRGAVLASPSLGDLNGDGYVNVVAADIQGTIYALDGRQGGLIWNSEFRSSGGAITAPPLLVDINEKDGELDVVVGTTTKGVLAIDGGTMRQIWVGQVGSAVPSTPAAADINADGTKDAFVATSEGRVICFDGRQGGPVWKFDTGAPLKTSPALADLNGDGVADVIIGAANNRLYCLDGKNGATVWVHVATEEPSTVACADFNNDRVADVAVVYPSNVEVLEGSRGSLLWKWTLPGSARPTKTDPFLPTPPATADLNGDKTPDVILATPGGHVYAVDGGSKGMQYIWDFGLTPTRKTAPALCDFNNDGAPDVVVGDVEGNVMIIDGKTGYQLNNLHVEGRIVAAPVIGDFTSDGTVNIAVGTQDKKIVAVQTETPVKKNQIVWNAF